MQCSKIQTKIDPSKNLEASREALYNSVLIFSFNEKIVDFESFINSDFWINIPKNKSSHDLLYSKIEATFGDIKKFIYDAGKITNGDSNFFNSLSQKQKDLIKKIDDEKNQGFFKLNNIIITYTGSTSVIEQPYGSTWKPVNTWSNH